MIVEKKQRSSLLFFLLGSVMSTFCAEPSLVNKAPVGVQESFIAEPVTVPATSDEKRDELTGQFVELYETFVHLCTELTRDVATLQDAQLAKVHQVIAQGESLSVKKMETLVAQLKNRIQNVEKCVAQLVKG